MPDHLFHRLCRSPSIRISTHCCMSCIGAEVFYLQMLIYSKPASNHLHTHFYRKRKTKPARDMIFPLDLNLLLLYFVSVGDGLSNEHIASDSISCFTSFPLKYCLSPASARHAGQIFHPLSPYVMCCWDLVPVCVHYSNSFPPQKSLQSLSTGPHDHHVCNLATATQ